MLTGDKGLTAKEIGISCGLITPISGISHEEKISSEKSENEYLGVTKENSVSVEQIYYTPALKMPTAGPQETTVFEFDENYTSATQLFEEI